jgi:cation-transporting ATPase E
MVTGDHPATAAAIADEIGLRRPGAPVLTGDDLPANERVLAALLDHDGVVVARVSPEDKLRIARALRSRGHVVAMTGDGVNDALALKDADIGVAMGSGSPATRAVAQLVLLDGRFAHLPHAVAEGRRVIANIERAANLFLVKNIYALVLALISVATLRAYPLAPIQLTLISTLTIGVPGFFLALAPNRRRYVRGFLGRVLRFSVPTGLITGIAAYAGYAAARWFASGTGVEGARTTATVVVLVVGLWTVGVLARPLVAWKLGLVVAMAGAAALVLVVPALSEGVFLLHVTPQVLLLAAVPAAAGALLVEVAFRVSGLLTAHSRQPGRIRGGV